MLARILLFCAIVLVIAVAPAAAADSTQVPEGSSFTLFALGLAGLVIGRRMVIDAKRTEKGPGQDKDS